MADEQDTQSGNDLTVMVEDDLFYKYNEHNSHKGEERCQRSHVEGNELARDGSSNVCSHDNPYCLLQRHHAGIYKSDNHDGSG